MKTDKEKLKLKGPVKTVQIESVFYQFQDGQSIERPGYSPTMIFNPDGWITEQFSQNSDGSEWRIVNDYSKAGKLTAARTYNDSDVPISETEYIYDAEGYLASVRTKDKTGNITMSAAYTCDSRGRKLKIQELSVIEGIGMVVGIEDVNSGIWHSGEISRSETIYDDRDEEIELRIFNSEGALVGRMEVRRDENGKPLEVSHYYGDIVEFSPPAAKSGTGKETAALTGEQKAEAEAEAARVFSPGSVMSKQVFKYNESGNLIETKQIMMGMEIERLEIICDEAGNKIEEVSHHQNGMPGNKTIFNRDYDEYGNWIKEIVLTASSSNENIGPSSPASTTQRTIAYYE